MVGTSPGGWGPAPSIAHTNVTSFSPELYFFWMIPPSGPGGLPRYSDVTHLTSHQHAFLSMPFALARSGPGPWPDGPPFYLNMLHIAYLYFIKPS